MEVFFGLLNTLFFFFFPFLSSLFFIPFPSNLMRQPHKCARPKVLQPRLLPSNYLIHQAKIHNNHAKKLT